MCSHMLRDRLFVSSSITRLCVVTTIKTIKILCSKQGYGFSGSAAVVFWWLHVFGSPIKTQKLQGNDTASLSPESPAHGSQKKKKHGGEILQVLYLLCKNVPWRVKTLHSKYRHDKCLCKLNFNYPK